MSIKLETNKNRVFELDFLRGLAIVMMILHHFIYDLRYLFELDVFAFQDSYFFIQLLRPPFVFIFLFVSGISSTFSKNNLIRSIRLILVALLFSFVFLGVSEYTGSNMYVIFNVLHLLALGTLIYAFLDYLHVKNIVKNKEKIFIWLTVILLWLYIPLSKLDKTQNILLTAFHESFSKGIGMADYMPIIPWLAFFFFGAFFGNMYYKEKKTLFNSAPKSVLKITRPFEFVGRNALVFYIFHQPVLISVLYILRVTEII